MSKKDGQLNSSQVLKAFLSLNPRSQQVAFELIQQTYGSNFFNIIQFIEDLREKRFNSGYFCPHCSSDQVTRNGTYEQAHGQRQRYKCKGCGRTFTDLTKTPFHGTHHPEKWLQLMAYMVKGFSVRKIAELLEIAPSTVFYWRHKILSALKRLPVNEFSGLLEVDETYFLYSEKGKKNIKGRKPRKRGGSSQFRGISREQVCVVVARDRTKNTLSQVACKGPINKLKAGTILTAYVGNVSMVCSDANGTWRVFSEERGIEHKELNLKRKRRVIKKIFHIQNVNAYHSRLKEWIQRFKGVATKYLDNYLFWFNFLDANSQQSTRDLKLELLLSICLPVSPERLANIRHTTLILP